MAITHLSAAGLYADPEDATSERYWSGWTKLTGVFVAVLATLWVVACGSQSNNSGSKASVASSGSTASVVRYEGTWVQTAQGAQQQDQMPRILVKKVGDKYAFTDPAGSPSKLIGLTSAPDSTGHFTIFAIELSENTLATPEGAGLTLVHSGKTILITVTGDTMTWTMGGEKFTFSRSA